MTIIYNFVGCEFSVFRYLGSCYTAILSPTLQSDCIYTPISFLTSLVATFIRIRLRICITLLSILFAESTTCLQAQDTSSRRIPIDSVTHTLPKVEVSAYSQRFHEVIPAQTLEGAKLKALNSLSVADAIRFFSGVQIKDYGGVGGLKTINVRSMGTHHVGVFFDGIQLGNAQNGQVDLGKFSMDNIEAISLYNGQKSNMLQPAKDYASSSSVYLRSRTPRFEHGKRSNLKAVVKTGSFGLIDPSILYEWKINDKVSASVNAEVINAHGKYKYRYKRVAPKTREVLYDTTAVRHNGDIFSQRLEAGLYGQTKDGLWRVKSYFYNSNRGLPGAIVNNRWKNSQRQWDRSFFTQGTYRQKVTEKYEIQANAKYAYDYLRYLNPDTTLLLVDNTFHQQEGYLSVANRYSPYSWWDMGLAVDLQYNTLKSNMSGFVFPRRLTSLVAAVTGVDLGSFKMQGSLLYTYVFERVHSGNKSVDDAVKAAPPKQRLTPALFVSYRPWERIPLNLRAFYKEIFRLPTFNDLYYTDLGNALLQPEDTHQYNLGIQGEKSYDSGIIRHWQYQVDGYLSNVTNKIVAIPKGAGLYRWMMVNLGTVKIRGVEASGDVMLSPLREMYINLRGSYTYQKALDYTVTQSPLLTEVTYGGQIPYIPLHSGSAIAGITYKGWSLNYSFIYVGERFDSSDNNPRTYEEPWYTNDVNLRKTFQTRYGDLNVGLEVNNVLDQQYEVVLNFPMPGRNYKLTLSLDL